MSNLAAHSVASMNQIGTNQNQRRLLLALTLLSLLAGFISATQYAAAALDYQPLLGFNLYGFYAPWMIMVWSVKWYSFMPDIFAKAYGLWLFITAAGLFATSITKFMLLNSAKANISLHGSARWATKEDIMAAGLIPNSTNKNNEAVYVGGWNDDKGKMHYLLDSGPSHVLTYAPTRSGKGVGLVIPTLLNWTKSTVIADLKGELWALTAGWRQQYAHNKVLRFEPASSSGSSVRWNPLAEIRIGTDDEVGDVQNIATLIVDPDGKGLNDHWAKTAYALLVGVIIHLKYQEQYGELFDENGNSTEANMYMVDRFLANPDKKKDDIWQEMIDYHHLRPTNWRSKIEEINQACTIESNIENDIDNHHDKDDQTDQADQEQKEAKVKEKLAKIKQLTATWQTHPAVATAAKDMIDLNR